MKYTQGAVNVKCTKQKELVTVADTFLRSLPWPSHPAPVTANVPTAADSRSLYYSNPALSMVPVRDTSDSRCPIRVFLLKIWILGSLHWVLEFINNISKINPYFPCVNTKFLSTKDEAYIHRKAEMQDHMSLKRHLHNLNY